MSTCKTTCSACPFRKKSAPGWLGAYTGPAHFLSVHYGKETVNPCHKTVDYEDPTWKEDFLSGRKGSKCRGQAEFFKNSLKLPRNSEIDRVPKNPNVFSNVMEFMKHHSEKPLKKLMQEYQALMWG